MAELRTSGVLLKKGAAAVFGRSTWSRRYFVLDGYLLRYYASDAPSEPERGSIDLARAELFTAEHSRYGSRYFELHVDGVKYPLATETDEEAAQWLRTLVYVIDLHAAMESASDGLADAFPLAAVASAPPEGLAAALPPASSVHRDAVGDEGHVDEDVEDDNDAEEGDDSPLAATLAAAPASDCAPGALERLLAPGFTNAVASHATAKEQGAPTSVATAAAAAAPAATPATAAAPQVHATVLRTSDLDSLKAAVAQLTALAAATESENHALRLAVAAASAQVAHSDARVASAAESWRNERERLLLQASAAAAAAREQAAFATAAAAAATRAHPLPQSAAATAHQAANEAAARATSAASRAAGPAAGTDDEAPVDDLNERREVAGAPVDDAAVDHEDVPLEDALAAWSRLEALAERMRLEYAHADFAPCVGDYEHVLLAVFEANSTRPAGLLPDAGAEGGAQREAAQAEQQQGGALGAIPGRAFERLLREAGCDVDLPRGSRVECVPLGRADVLAVLARVTAPAAEEGSQPLLSYPQFIAALAMAALLRFAHAMPPGAGAVAGGPGGGGGRGDASDNASSAAAVGDDASVCCLRALLATSIAPLALAHSLVGARTPMPLLRHEVARVAETQAALTTQISGAASGSGGAAGAPSASASEASPEGGSDASSSAPAQLDSSVAADLALRAALEAIERVQLGGGAGVGSSSSSRVGSSSSSSSPAAAAALSLNAAAAPALARVRPAAAPRGSLHGLDVSLSDSVWQASSRGSSFLADHVSHGLNHNVSLDSTDLAEWHRQQWEPAPPAPNHALTRQRPVPPAGAGPVAAPRVRPLTAAASTPSRAAPLLEHTREGAPAASVQGPAALRASMTGPGAGTLRPASTSLQLHSSSRDLELARAVPSLLLPPYVLAALVARGSSSSSGSASSSSGSSGGGGDAPAAGPLLSSEPSAQRVLAREGKALDALWGYYAQARVAKLPCATAAAAALLDQRVWTPRDVSRWAADFGIVPGILAGHGQLQQLLLGVLQSPPPPQPPPGLAAGAAAATATISSGGSEWRVAVAPGGVVAVSSRQWRELLVRLGVLGQAGTRAGVAQPDARAVLAAMLGGAPPGRGAARGAPPATGGALGAAALFVLRVMDSSGGRERMVASRDGRAGAAAGTTLRFATRGAARE